MQRISIRKSWPSSRGTKLMQNEICPFDDHFLKISNGCSRGTILMQIKIVSRDVMG